MKTCSVETDEVVHRLKLKKRRPRSQHLRHKAVFNLSGINASAGSSDTQLLRTKADYHAGAGVLGALQRCAPEYLNDL